MITDIGALVLFSGRVPRVVEFYRALGAPLVEEDHGDGAIHFACELGTTHFAVFESALGEAPPHRSGGSQFVGLTVTSAEAALQKAEALGAPVIEAVRVLPWGKRALVTDPDGRTVELFERPRAESD